MRAGKEEMGREGRVGTEVREKRMKTERRAVKKNHFIPKYLHLRAICPQFWEFNHTTEVCAHKYGHTYTHTAAAFAGSGGS